MKPPNAVHRLLLASTIAVLTAGDLKKTAQVAAPVATGTDATRSAGGGRFFGSPVLGYVHSAASNELRAILGIPGAARLSGPIRLPKTVTRVRLAPSHRYAFLEYEQDSGLAVAILDDSYLTEGAVEAFPSGETTPLGSGIQEPEPLPAIQIYPLHGAMAKPDLVEFSPGGKTGVLYSGASRRAQIFTELPSGLEVVWEFRPNDLPLAGLRRLAVSDDARTVIGVDEHGAVYQLTGHGPISVFASSEAPVLAFAPGRSDLWLFDQSTNSVFLIEGLNSLPAIRRLPSNLGLTKVDHAVVTSDGRYLLIASSDSSSISWIDLNSGVTIAEETIAPGLNILAPLRNQVTYLVSASPNLPTWLVIASGPDMGRLHFVPGE